MIVTTAPRFVPDQRALDELLTGKKQMACPHCHRQGTLVGHGVLTGYAERGSERVLRGRRLLCSARYSARGCGRTFSVLLATVLARFTARTETIAALLHAVVGGQSRKAAWENAQSTGSDAPGLSLRSGYRLWDRLLGAQSRIRAALFARTPPPESSDPRPIAQMLAHLRHALGDRSCVLASFQLVLQRGLFD
jgi:transposase-like protein